jgi:phosphoenolpyruvate-protein kinase (PTS system EI component)
MIFLANIWGFIYLQRKWFIIGAGVLLLLILLLSLRGCGSETVTPIDSEKLEIEKQSIERTEREELNKTLDKVERDLENINRQVREAEANTNKTIRDSRNKNVSEQELREKLKNL